ncbi:MAG: hypothetical protein C4313_08310 [Thermoflexus sp.]|mgnify:CR=1 FL=1|uniref:hypothetical protein n=1 Tax=Thermoflexus sp. TaxID=1969742 RepID=UPI0033270256
MIKETLNPFQIVQKQLDEVAQVMGLEPHILEMLRWPKLEIQVTLSHAEGSSRDALKPSC